ncbi:MAG: hypothetical protein V3U49_01280 [Nitrososphaerales archaeon]
MTRKSPTDISLSGLSLLTALLAWKHFQWVPPHAELDELSPIEIAELKISRAERARGLSKTFDNVQDLIKDLKSD